MDKPFLLHMFTPAKHISPFDVNMAYDAGWDAAPPYTSVETDEVRELVQDAIFSRGPKGVRRTALFIGGRDIHTAMGMLEAARKSMVPPFEVSVFADPSGAFTTAAAMVAAVERRLETDFDADLAGKRALVFGGTGPVGAVTAVLAAKMGANVYIVGRDIEKSREVAAMCNERYGAGTIDIKGEANAHKVDLLDEAELVFATAKAGVQLLDQDLVAGARHLEVAADVNAVPPSGIAGLGMQDDGRLLPDSRSGAVGIGALAIGSVKYKTQHELLRRMREADRPLYLHFEQAFEFARQHAR